MSEKRILFQVTREEDGVDVQIHCEDKEEIFNVVRSITAVALEDDAFCWMLLLSLRHAFSEEGQKEYNEHTVEMPDFDELLKNIK